LDVLKSEDLHLLKELNILYVEDDVEVREYFSTFFAKFCKKIYTAVNGQEGYEKFVEHCGSENDIDLIISDTNMPVLSGMDMASKIRESSQVPIIMITANEELDNFKKAFEIGIIGYILKPIDMRDLFNNISRAMVIVKNIRYEKELKRLNETLEHRVKQQEEQLVKQSRHAAMGEMISMIAHQWRQPLSTISSIVSNVKISVDLNEIEPKLLKNDLSKITELTLYLSKTINDFRNFFLPNKSKEISDITILTHEAHSLLEHMLMINDVEFVNKCKDLSKIYVYKNEFVQVLINIIKNAIDQLAIKGIENRNIWLDDYEDGEFVVVTISDNAGGIDTDIIDKVFEPYFSTKSEKNGTGLGLYMSKMIIEEHLDGKISVENNELGGVTFKIKLPKAKEIA
jgi:C4-dicarboxylate-specific signal transduction histidine kinase